MSEQLKSSASSSSRQSSGRLYLHVAGWPGRCVDCEALVRNGEPMVFRSGGKRELRWCARCGLALEGEITPTRAYVTQFGAGARAQLTAAGRPGAAAVLSRAELEANGLLGRRVRIRRGAVILSDTSPRARPRVARRAQIVKVVEVLGGAGRDGPPRPETIRWAGVGGYLREVAVADIAEVVE